MLFSSAIESAYKKAVKPVLFRYDAEGIHNAFTTLGEWLGSVSAAKCITGKIFSYKNPALSQNMAGLDLENPVGLAAGFDYDGHLAEIMPYVGFGFSTVGTVTAKTYIGNTPPRLGRMPLSKALIVNKGFKSEGADSVLKRLDKKNLKNTTIGISVGSSNLPEVNSTEKAIDDYIYTFNTFRNRAYVKYFELNISCPNTSMTESFSLPENFSKLISCVASLNLKKPVFVKMPNEISPETAEKLVNISLKQGINTFIFSNLVKDRDNKGIVGAERLKYSGIKGNISGRPTFEGAVALVAGIRRTFGKNVAIIGCGGIFSVLDAIRMIESGADALQLITGMIYEGPQLVGEMNYKLYRHIKKMGFENVLEYMKTVHRC